MRKALAVAVLILSGCRPFDPGVQVDDAPSPALADEPRPALATGEPLRVVRIIDGDTFEYQGEIIRIANIDTPEAPPRSRCLAEERLASRAEKELGAIMGGFYYVPRLEREREDRYGRTIARVYLPDGTDVGEAMIARGVAEPWRGRREDWCGPR